ncbi:MAG: hypothetical protein ABIH42_11425 [Planctomycetota bacterium]
MRYAILSAAAFATCICILTAPTPLEREPELVSLFPDYYTTEWFETMPFIDLTGQGIDAKKWIFGFGPEIKFYGLVELVLNMDLIGFKREEHEWTDSAILYNPREWPILIAASLNKEEVDCALKDLKISVGDIPIHIGCNYCGSVVEFWEPDLQDLQSLYGFHLFVVLYTGWHNISVEQLSTGKHAACRFFVPYSQDVLLLKGAGKDGRDCFTRNPGCRLIVMSGTAGVSIPFKFWGNRDRYARVLGVSDGQIAIKTSRQIWRKAR